MVVPKSWFKATFCFNQERNKALKEIREWTWSSATWKFIDRPVETVMEIG